MFAFIGGGSVVGIMVVVGIIVGAGDGLNQLSRISWGIGSLVTMKRFQITGCKGAANQGYSPRNMLFTLNPAFDVSPERKALYVVATGCASSTM